MLPRISEALARASLEDGEVKLMKVDLKDGFWRVMCKKGEEWNFAYVLPNHPDQPVEIVIPAALQMGWVQSPAFFCAASETSRDVAESLVHEPVGTLLQHPLGEHTIPKNLTCQSATPQRKNVSSCTCWKFL